MKKITKAEFLQLYEEGKLLEILVLPIAVLAIELNDDGSRKEGVWVELP